MFDSRGIIHWKQLPCNQTLTAEICCAQLERIVTALKGKRPSLVNRGNVIFQTDNPRRYTVNLT